jgi:hypothetical protein
MGFADSVRINANKILEETQAKCYTIMDDLFTEVILETPVGQTRMEQHPGLLKNNWFSSTGDSISSATTPINDPGGNDSLLNVAILRDTDLFHGKDSIASLTNNISYGVLAEYLGWEPPQWSGTVGPYSMVRNSLSRIASKYQ